MKYLLIFIFSLSLLSCDDYQYVWGIDCRLKEHVDCFFIEAASRGIYLKRENLIAGIVNTPNSNPNPFEPGIHRKQSTGQKLIMFDEYIFNTNTYQENEVMVFHELGHWLGLEHCECPENTIMNESPNMYMYVKHPELREGKINDLFRGIPGN
jgi:hypothetical protein